MGVPLSLPPQLCGEPTFDDNALGCQVLRFRGTLRAKAACVNFFVWTYLRSFTRRRSCERRASSCRSADMTFRSQRCSSHGRGRADRTDGDAADPVRPDVVERCPDRERHGHARRLERLGSSVAVDPFVMLYGLQSTNPLADGSKAWPASASAFASGDLTYADGTPYVPGVGQPGIVATYKNAGSFYPPEDGSGPNSPTANQAFMVLRTQVRLYGTSTSCTSQSGQAFVTNLNHKSSGACWPVARERAATTSPASSTRTRRSSRPVPARSRRGSWRRALRASSVISALP